MSHKQKVVVGMSGGVDSSVAALLLKQQGYHVVGLFMKNWEDDDDDEYCSTRQDLVDVVSVADVIGIDLEVVNFSKEYKERVFAGFLSEYEAGRTPNPDILCNSEIKFRAFLDHAMALGADRIATGHYAQVREWTNDGRTEYQLMKAEDGTKDQSYFLYRLNQAQLSKTLFPIGHLYKRDVRYLPARPGEIRTLDGDRVIGQHQGLMHHTIGQRKGLQIGGIKGNQDDAGEHDAWYVAQKDVAKNVLYVVQSHDHPALLKDRLIAADLSWVSGHDPRTHWVYTAKPRYRTPDAPCEIDVLAAGRAEIAFA